VRAAWRRAGSGKVHYSALLDFLPLANPNIRANVPSAMKLPHTLALMSLFSFLFGFARAEPLKIGDKAPQISATTDAGTTLNLGDVYQQNDYTLVWFYPKALTGGCTKQGCSLRDAHSELKQKGVAVVGVSTDPVAKQKEFKEKNNFPFPLLSDTDKKVIKAFGQAGIAVASREAYLINRQGKVVYHDVKETDQQAEKVLAFLNAQKS
jgi:peroxiredoxin Q/BCP